jgi:hypothetical protein
MNVADAPAEKPEPSFNTRLLHPDEISLVVGPGTIVSEAAPRSRLQSSGWCRCPGVAHAHRAPQPHAARHAYLPEYHLLACVPGIVQRGHSTFVFGTFMHTSRDGGQTCDGTRVKLSERHDHSEPVAREALVAVGRRVANQARSRRVLSQTVSTSTSPTFSQGVFPRLMPAPGSHRHKRCLTWVGVGPVPRRPASRVRAARRSMPASVG